MFGQDDDSDFTPSSNSKLASLFGGVQPTDDGNVSFTFAAPKQPKKPMPPEDNHILAKARTSLNLSSAPDNINSIIIVKAVLTYMFVEGKYAPQGKLGAAIIGNVLSHSYRLLLYKGKQQHITSTPIGSDFQFTMQANKYGTFYNEQGQNWSLHFEDEKDGEEFAREVGLARVGSRVEGATTPSLMTQVLSAPPTSDGPVAAVGDSVEIYYTVQTYATGKIGQLIESNQDAQKPQRVKVRKNVWEEGLIGASPFTKRMIWLPPTILGPWKSSVPEGTSLVVEVEITGLRQGRRSPSGSRLLADSEVDSSADDQSIRARAEALTNSPRAHKASIINRMARMGQPTLPLKGATVAKHPSDSEETGDESSITSASAIAPKPTKSRVPKSRPIASHPPPASEMQLPAGVPPSQMAVYQQLPVTWQQQQAYGMVPQYRMPDGQLYPLQSVSSQPLYTGSTSAVVSPTSSTTSPDLSVFFSEARTHNTEVRMAVTKVTDKVDQVLSKLDSVYPRNYNFTGPTLDSSTLIGSVQKIIQENELLKTELIEKRSKLEIQNDRIYQLLNTNQKYIDHNSVDQEAIITSLKREKEKIISELSEAKAKVITLQMHEARTCNENEGAGLQALIEKQKAELALSTDCVSNKEAQLEALREKLKETELVNEAHEKTIADMQQRANDLRLCKEGMEKALSEVTHQLKLQKKETEQNINQLHSKYTERVTLLEKQCMNLKTTVDALKSTAEPVNASLVILEVKRVMNTVWKSLQTEFNPAKNYKGADVREAVMETIREVTSQFVELKMFTGKEQVIEKSSNPPVEVGDKVTKVKPRVKSQKPPVAEKESAPVENAEKERATGDNAEKEHAPVENAKKEPVAGENPEKESATGENDSIYDAKDRKGTQLLEQKVQDMPIRQRLTAGDTSVQSNVPLELNKEQVTIVSDDPKGVEPTNNQPTAAPRLESSEKLNVSKNDDAEGWRPQPPPPPLFDDEDDEDDWLS